MMQVKIRNRGKGTEFERGGREKGEGNSRRWIKRETRNRDEDEMRKRRAKIL